MKKIAFVGIAMAYLLVGCHTHTTDHHDHDHDHGAHDHAAHEHAAHAHEAEHDHDAHHGHEAHEHTHDEAGHAGEIAFKKAQAEAVGLKTCRVEPGPFTGVIKTSGHILAAQGEESTVVATVPGVVTFGNVPFVEGTALRKGQPILSLASHHLSEGNVAAKAKYAYEQAKKEFERMESLVADRIVSAKEFEQARLKYENAKAAWEVVADKQTKTGVSVVSPIHGYLKNLQVKEGDYVTVGQPLATISQHNRLMLRAEVSEKYYPYLSSIRSANFRTPYDNRTYQLAAMRGRLLTYGKASNDNSFYVPVTFEFDNKGTVIAGSYVEVYLLTNPMEGVIHLPVTALIEEQGVYSVYVRVHDEAYKKVPVTLGADNGIEVQIQSGLHPGDEVVTEGAYQIKLASASNAIPAHSHSH